MAPKKKFSKQDIIDTAFEIAKEEGFDAITIRKVAERLGSSIAPIYVNFNNVDELIQAVVHKTFDVTKEILSEQNTGQPFRDIGIASLRFAKEYNVLFRDLVMNHSTYMKYERNDIHSLIAQMKTDPHLEELPENELKEILLKMQIFQTGLSVMVANGLLPENFNEENVIQMMDSVAEDIILSAHQRIRGK